MLPEIGETVDVFGDDTKWKWKPATVICHTQSAGHPGFKVREYNGIFVDYYEGECWRRCTTRRVKGGK